MSDSSPKNKSGLSDMAQRALDAILGRGKDKDDRDEEKAKDRDSASVGRREGSGGGSAEDILSAGAQSAARSANQSTSPTTGDADSGVSIGNQAGSPAAGNSSSGAVDIASAGVGAASSAIASGSSSTSSDATDVYMGGPNNDTGYGGGVVEEEFVGSGGVGSAEFMEDLRKGHEAAGGEYTSDLSDPNNPDDGPGKV